jgi:hypothetical protein
MSPKATELHYRQCWGQLLKLDSPTECTGFPSSFNSFRVSSSCLKSLSILFLPPYSHRDTKMPGGGVVAVTGTTDVNRVEAPVTVRAYLIVAFAAFGGIFFGYDTGWMGGVLGMDYFIKQYTGHEYPDVLYHGLASTDPMVKAYRKSIFVVPQWQQSLVTSILSAGTFFGAIMAGDIADFIGRRPTIIGGCILFAIGGILETASTGLNVMVGGRLVAGFGVGFISAVVIL